MPLPNLLIIGSMKCGTTSLHHYLNNHSDVYMSEIKELDFFLGKERWEKGFNWYKDQFSENHKINGESSQNYTKRHHHEGVVKRIKEHLPETKLIYIVRDPIKRIESHFKDVKTYGYVKYDYDINDVVKENINHPIFLTSHYYYQIEPYLESFPREQILFIKLEDLNCNTFDTLNKVFDFLEVSPLRENSFFEEKHNTSNEKLIEKPVVSKFRNSALYKSLKWIIPVSFLETLKDNLSGMMMESVNNKYNALTEDSVEILKRSLKADLEKFYNVSGIDFIA